MNTNFTDTEYVILENIYSASRQNPPLRQRDLAQIARTSLGMTNSILKRLAQKGWITVKKLNSRNIQYAVTLEGFNEIIHRSYGYFKRTIKNVVFYKDTIDDIVRKAGRKNINTVLLIGLSDLEFIVEHACHRWGLSFLKTADKAIINDSLNVHSLVVYSEDIPASSEGPLKNTFFLSELLIKGSAVS
jgi:DNA-binding MarR family transcriptional regulator